MPFPRLRSMAPASRRGWLVLGLSACGLLVILACGACAWFWHARYTASPSATVDRLNKAIANQDLALLAMLVDSDALATDFAQVVASAMPETDIRQAATLVQMTMLTILKDETPPHHVLAATLPVLPGNVRAQFVQRPFTLEEGPTPEARCVVEHPVLGQLTLRLGLTREGRGWRIRQLVNAAELVHRYNASVQEHEHQRREAEIRSIQESKAMLARTFPDPVCSGGVMRISGNVPLLSLSMNAGPNPGPQTVEAWGATLTLSHPDGTILATPRIMMRRAIEPGSSAEGNWSRDIDEEVYQRLVGLPVSCSVHLDYAALNNGKVYSVTPDS